MTELLLKGEPIGKVKCILFDKDGTISNSEGYLLSLAQLRINQSILHFKKRKASKETILKLEFLLNKAYGVTKKGLRPDSTLAIASRNHNLISTATIFCLLEDSWPNALNLANSIFNKADTLKLNKQSHSQKRNLLPGFINFFNQLKHQGIICALISNDNSFGINNFLVNNNLDKEITHFWSCDNIPVKPNPQAVEKLCKIVKVNPKNCALIGDSDSDLQMARQAGIQLALGYTGGWRTAPLLNHHHHLIHHWDEIRLGCI